MQSASTSLASASGSRPSTWAPTGCSLIDCEDRLPPRRAGVRFFSREGELNQAIRAAFAALVGVFAAFALPSVAAANPPDPGAYQQDDYADGNAYNIVPPGQNGFESTTDVLQFLTNGVRPPHQYDQNDMYANLVYATPGLQASQILDYFKDASFGVKPGDVEGTETPNCFVVVPPVGQQPRTATTSRSSATSSACPTSTAPDRAALMFGIGYATGEDRLFFVDVLRHAGRAQLSSFVGGCQRRPGPRRVWANARTRTTPSSRPSTTAPTTSTAQRGAQIQDDVQNYVDGMNQWIAEAKAQPDQARRASTPLTNHPLGPGLEGHGRDRHRRARRRDLRQGRRRASSARPRRCRTPSRSRHAGRASASGRTSARPTTPRRRAPSTSRTFPYRAAAQGTPRGMAMPDPGSVRAGERRCSRAPAVSPRRVADPRRRTCSSR